MGIKRLQCIFIGPKSKLYVDFLGLLKKLQLNSHVKQTGLKNSQIAYALKKSHAPCLVIISDEVNFPLGNLSDLVWRYSSDAIIVIVTNKTITTSLKKPFNTTQIAKLLLDKKSNESRLFLEYITQYAQLKWDFRRCKRLLGVSEKRTQRMLDSSREAIAYTSRDMHLYANASYLGLFDVDSIENLQRTPVQEFIKEGEVGLYRNFVNQQLRRRKMEISLILSMKKANGLGFRANIHVIPAVYKGKKCLQLWVRQVNSSNIDRDEPILDTKDSNKSIESEQGIAKIKKKEIKIDAVSILKEVLKRKEASISFKPIKVMQKDKVLRGTEHLKLALKIKSSQKNHINNLLSESKDEQIIFWDRLKLTRLLQILIKKKIDKKLYINLSTASFNNETLMNWLIKSIHQLGSKSSNLIFLVPYKLNKDHNKSSIQFLARLQATGCEIAFDEFYISTEHLMALKMFKPNYISLSPSWVNGVNGNDTREVALGSLVRQFESKNIQVIAPCGLSKDIKKLFTLSGASFCLE